MYGNIGGLTLVTEGLFDFFKKKEDPSMLCSIKIPTKFLDNIDNAYYDDDETELSVWEVFKRITLPEDWDDRWVGILYGRSFEPYWVIEEATPSGSGSDINDRIKWLWSELNPEIKDINKLSKLIQQKKFVEAEPYAIKLVDLKHLDINKPEEVINIISKEDEVPGFLNRIKELKEDYPENKQEIDKVVSELFKMFNIVKKSRLELFKVLKPYLIDPKNIKKEELPMTDEVLEEAPSEPVQLPAETPVETTVEVQEEGGENIENQESESTPEVELSQEGESVEVQVPSSEGETTITLDMPGYLDSVQGQLSYLHDTIKHLESFKADPHKTIGELADEGKPFASDFAEIKEALVGAFTSEKAALLGVKKLTSIIEAASEKIKTDYGHLSNKIINSCNTDNHDNLNSIVETTDPGMLEKRKIMYRQNNVTLKYANYKLEKCIQPYIQEISAGMSMLDYLKRIRELQHSLKFDRLQQLEEVIRKYKYNNVFIGNNNVYIGKSQFMENQITVDEPSITNNSSLEEMKEFISKVDISQDHDTVAIDVLDNIIDNFASTLSGLKRSVEDMNKLLASIGDNNSKFNDTVDILINNYVIPYADNTVLKDDYALGYKQCMLALHNCINNDRNLVTEIVLNQGKLENLLNIYSYLYSLLEKLTIEMTITEKSSMAKD